MSSACISGESGAAPVRQDRTLDRSYFFVSGFYIPSEPRQLNICACTAPGSFSRRATHLAQQHRLGGDNAADGIIRMQHYYLSKTGDGTRSR